MMAVLQTIDLKKYYGEGENQVKALDGICLEIEEGKFTAIVGTSGSGKSTLSSKCNLRFYLQIRRSAMHYVIHSAEDPDSQSHLLTASGIPE